MRELRVQIMEAESARDAGDRLRNRQGKELKEREAAGAATSAQFSAAQTKIAASEAELTKAQEEKADLQKQIRENENEITQLRKRVAETGEIPAVPANPPNASTVDLQAELEAVKKQLEDMGYTIKTRGAWSRTEIIQVKNPSAPLRTIIAVGDKRGDDDARGW